MREIHRDDNLPNPREDLLWGRWGPMIAGISSQFCKLVVFFKFFLKEWTNELCSMASSMEHIR